MEIAILVAGAFVFVAYLLEYVFDKTRIPDILLWMLIGLLAGPVTGIVELAWFGEVGRFLSTLALVVILFESGLNLNIKTLIGAAGRAVPFALLAMGGSVAAITWLLMLFVGLDLWMAILGGFIMSGTSSAVVIPMLKGLGTRESVGTVLMLESAITDVLCIIGAVGIATALEAGLDVKAQGLASTAAVSMLAATALGIGSGFAWAFLNGLVTKLREGMFTSLAFALVVYGASEALAISGAIAALALGITLGNLPRRAEEEQANPSGYKKHERGFKFGKLTLSEMRLCADVVFLLKAAFFFYLGLTVRPQAFASTLGLAAAIMAVAVFIPRYPAVVIMMGRKFASRQEATTAWALGPRGLGAAVLAQLPMELGLANAQPLAEVVALMVFISITLVAVFVFFIERGWADPFSAIFFGMYSKTLELPQAAASEGVDTDDGKEPSDATSTEGEPAAEPATEEAPETVGERAGEAEGNRAPQSVSTDDLGAGDPASPADDEPNDHDDDREDDRKDDDREDGRGA